MKNEFDTYFGIALIILTAALVLFPFWIIQETKKIPSGVVLVPVYMNHDQAVSGGAKVIKIGETSNLQQGEEVDPLFVDVVAEDASVDVNVDELDSLTETDDVSLDDLDL